MLTSAQFPRHLQVGIMLIYGLEYKEYPEEYSLVFDGMTSSKAYEEIDSMVGFGLVPTKDEGKSIEYDEAFAGFSKRYTHVEYGLGFNVTRPLWEDEQYGKIKKLPTALAKSVRQTVEILHANVLNNAFNSSYPCPDAKELCATDHPLKLGGTFANELATAADFDVTSLEAALIGIQNFVDDRGLKMFAQPRKLVIHPNDVFMAKQVLKSAQLPGTANNDINPAQDIIPEGYAALHWLTDSDAWWIKTDVANALISIWRRRPEFTRDNDWESENGKFKTTFRLIQGPGDPRGIYGSPGA